MKLVSVLAKASCTRTRITGSDTQPYLQEFFNENKLVNTLLSSNAFQCFQTKKNAARASPGLTPSRTCKNFSKTSVNTLLSSNVFQQRNAARTSPGPTPSRNRKGLGRKSFGKHRAHASLGPTPSRAFQHSNRAAWRHTTSTVRR